MTFGNQSRVLLSALESLDAQIGTNESQARWPLLLRAIEFWVETFILSYPGKCLSRFERPIRGTGLAHGLSQL